MKQLKFVLCGVLIALLFGCSPSEQTTEADLKAATAGQKPDPDAANVASPFSKGKKATP